MPEPATVLWFLAGWAIRATMLAVIAALILAGLRVKDVRIRLEVWTLVLAASLIAPAARAILPAWAVSFPQSPVTARLAPLPSVPGSTIIIDARSLHPHALPWELILVILWVTVAALLLARTAVGARGAWRLRKSAQPVPEWNVFESAALTVPVTVGLFRPVVLIPAAWREWAAKRRRKL